jgi:hypothetical protein
MTIMWIDTFRTDNPKTLYLTLVDYMVDTKKVISSQFE